MDQEKAIREFLGNQPDSTQLRLWRETLAERLRRVRADLATASPEVKPQIVARAAELQRQIAALEQEELITGFVEDSVRATLAMGSAVDGEQEDAD